MRYPYFKAIEIDENRLIINIVNPIQGKRDYTLMAPSRPIFDKVIAAFEVSGVFWGFALSFVSPTPTA
jgi:hypothetical protein